MKLLITGSNGLLGQKIVNQCLKKNIDFVATSLGENRNSNCPKNAYFSLDIRSEVQVHNCITKFNPTHVIHTAAMTNVDQCELNPAECNELNVMSTKFLWEICLIKNIHKAKRKAEEDLFKKSEQLSIMKETIKMNIDNNK